jgi:hypothetical protein
MMQQVITPNPNIPCKPGWCLMYVRQTFGLPARYASATEAWENSASQHRDRNFPSGVWVPVWYGIDREPLGHVVLLAPDGSVYSTSDNSTIPHHHPSLADLEDFYAGWGWPLTYRGWTEDVAGYPVIEASSTINFDSDTITPIQEDDMPSLQEIFDYQLTAPDGSKITLGEMVTESRPGRTNIITEIQKVPAAVVHEKFTRVGKDGQPAGQTTLAAVVGAQEANVELSRDLTDTSPDVVVDSIIAAGIAKDVADLLAERLAR